jgi:nitrogen regulatory protein PII
MKRITTVLRESEAMAVRKAVCVAGGECVVITSIPQHMCAIKLGEWHCKQAAAKSEVHVRLEVTADDSHYDGIVSAILRIANVGKIELASRHDRLLRYAA